MRKPNSALRTREYLLESEINLMLEAARKSKRYPHRNYCLVLLMFRHGLRVSEASFLEWSQIDLDSETIYVRRLKGSKASTHPLKTIEIMALKLLERTNQNPYVFLSERNQPLARRTIQYIIKDLGQRANLGFPTHPHMMRHACGYRLANDGIDTRAIGEYLGHTQMQSTVIYTELSPHRFDNFFED